MAKYRCPCCGAAFDGKRCRQCLYESFNEEITHGLHTHNGEPLVINAPVRKPIPRKDPLGCDKKTKKKPKRRFAAVILAVILAFPVLTLELILGIAAKTGELISTMTAEREPEATIPEAGTLLYDEDGIRIVAAWQDGWVYSDSIPVVVQNGSGQDITVSTRDIIVNGYVMDYSYLYCAAEEGRTEEGRFYLDETDLRNTGIRDVQEISFCLNIFDSD